MTPKKLADVQKWKDKLFSCTAELGAAKDEIERLRAEKDEQVKLAEMAIFSATEQREYNQHLRATIKKMATENDAELARLTGIIFANRCRRLWINALQGDLAEEEARYERLKKS